MTTPREADLKDQAPRPPEAANSDRTVGTRGREVRRQTSSNAWARGKDESWRGLLSVRTSPVTGEPFPRSTASVIRTRWLHHIHVRSAGSSLSLRPAWPTIAACGMTPSDRCLGAVCSITTFIRDLRTLLLLLQIWQFAQLRMKCTEDSC